MSNASAYGQRSSWRQKPKAAGNRWPARILMGMIAAALIGGLIYIFLPGPKRELHAFLIHAGSYDTDMIVPPMFGATARDSIITELGRVTGEELGELTGTVETVREKIASSLRGPLQDPDDTTLLWVRGYLLTDGAGQPGIACSDLGVGPTQSSPTGLLPLNNLLHPLASDGPSSFSGTRLVVLDVEPLSGLPQLGQGGDQALQTLAEIMKNLDGPHADRVWVLVTRGPLQNVGWDPKSKMPIATQTLLAGLTGDADLSDPDYRITLDELCKYISIRYQKLDRRAELKIMLLQGRAGIVDQWDKIDLAWINRAEPKKTTASDDGDSKTKPTDESNDDQPPDEKSKEIDAIESDHVMQPALRLTEVRYRVADAQADREQAAQIAPGNDPASTDSAGTEPAGGNPIDAPDVGSASQDAETEAPKPAAPSETDQQVARNNQAPETFWDLRDRFESTSRESTSSGPRIHPIAVAPQVWRKLVQKVLHAEIESFDSRSPDSRSSIPADAQRDLTSLQQTVDARNTVAVVEYREVNIRKLYELWKQATDKQLAERFDDQVRVANQLQHAIVAGKMRVWGALLFQEQGIIADCDGVDDVQLSRDLRQAEKTLEDQSGSKIQLAEMQRNVQSLQRSIDAFDANVEKRISNLVDENFGRANKSHAWREIQQAYAWLRSSLPSGPQRRKLQHAIDQVAVERFQLDPEEKLETPPLSDGIADRDLLSRVDSMVSNWLDFGASTDSASKLAANNDAALDSFPTRFDKLLRIDPRETNTATATLLLHSVTAVPHEPNPTSRFLDSDRRPIESEFVLQSFQDHLFVDVFPDSDQDTSFYLRWEFDPPSSKWDLDVAWYPGPGVQIESDQRIKLVIPKQEHGLVRLNVAAKSHAKESLKKIPISIKIDPIDDGPASSDLTSSDSSTGQSKPGFANLDMRMPLKIGLPLEDKIRAAVKIEGLTNEFRSGDDLRDGVWLRTFAARPTKFSLALFNNANRTVQAKVWLIKLPHPFPGEGVVAYWPDVMEKKLDALRNQLIDQRGQVFEQILAGDQKLKGPVSLQLSPDSPRTELDWTVPLPTTPTASPPASPSGSNPAATGQSATTPSDSGVDVSNGMALVVRLMEGDQILPGGDQIIWLIAKPWHPEDYVQINSMPFVKQNGEVHVEASIKKRIDGDRQDDIIPNLERSELVVRWTEDDQWYGFVSGTRELRSRETSLSAISGSGGFEVPVAIDTNETLVRLDVDGWPRALKWSVPHRPGKTGTKRTRWDTVTFSSVSIDYGDKIPGGKDDLPITDTTRYYPSDQVAFRGGGKSLTMRIAADFSDLAFNGDANPEILIRRDGKPWKRFWTDRQLHTVATELKDKGPITLLTTIEDLVVTTTDAKNRDDNLLFDAELILAARGARPIDAKRITLILDSTPPIVSGLEPTRSGPYYVGQELEWRFACDDPGRVGRLGSGVATFTFGIDGNGDDQPDRDKRTPVTERGSNDTIKNNTLKLDEKGTLRVAARVWDAAGLASQPVGDSIPVVERPQPIPPRDPTMANAEGAGKGTSAPPQPAKRGAIKGKIDTRSTLRGDLQLAPAPDKMQPADGKVIGRRCESPLRLFQRAGRRVYADLHRNHQRIDQDPRLERFESKNQ